MIARDQLRSIIDRILRLKEAQDSEQEMVQRMALARALGATLLTADAKLARAAGVPVQLV